MEEGNAYYATGLLGASEGGKGYINAFNLDTLDFSRRYLQIGRNKGWGGVMFTATGLVAFGDDADNFVVLNGRTGQPLWHFHVGQLIHSSPMSYAVDGKQYFAVAAGSVSSPSRCPNNVPNPTLTEYCGLREFCCTCRLPSLPMAKPLE